MIVYLVTCAVKACPVFEYPYGFPDSMKNEANEQRKLHSRNHPENPQAVKVERKDYD